MCSLSRSVRKCFGRFPFTVTLATDSALDRSRLNVWSSASVTAVTVAVPASRLMATLYSSSNSYRDTR